MPAGTTNTIFFIDHKLKLAYKKTTYVRIVPTKRPHKKEIKQVRLAVRGDRIQYNGDLATPTSNLTTVKSHITTVKCHLKSMVSTPGTQYTTIDIKNIYLRTPMQVYEFTRVPLSAIPLTIMKHYNLIVLAKNGYMIVEIQRGMYGLS